MKVYFAPLACSLATRIALYEANAEVEFVEVNTKTHRTEQDQNYYDVHALGLVPALVLEDGTVIAENAAVLQYVAQRFPEAELAPADALGRARLQQLLCFIGTELHKALYVPLLDRNAPEAVKAYALAKEESRLSWLSAQLSRGDFLLERFSVADAYLFAILNWSLVAPVKLERFTPITEFMSRMRARPAVARALAEETELYRRELSRNAAA